MGREFRIKDISTMKWDTPTKQKIEALSFGLLFGVVILLELGVLERDTFGFALSGLTGVCLLTIFALLRDLEYRPHSIVFKNKENLSKPEPDPEQEPSWWVEQTE